MIYGLPVKGIQINKSFVIMKLEEKSQLLDLEANNRFFFICDRNQNRILVLDIEKNFSFLTQWGVSGTEPGQLYSPVSLLCYQNDYLYVCDSNGIQLFNVNGEFIQRVVWWKHPNIWMQGNGMCQRNKKLYVADMTNRCIQVFESLEIAESPSPG